MKVLLCAAREVHVEYHIYEHVISGAHLIYVCVPCTGLDATATLNC